MLIPSAQIAETLLRSEPELDDDLGRQSVCEEETALRYLPGIATDLGTEYEAGRVNSLFDRIYSSNSS